MSESTHARRRGVAGSLLVLAGLVVAVAMVLAYARAEILHPEGFADRVTESTRQEPVRALLAERITTEVIERAQPDAIIARPVIEGIVAGVVGSQSMRPLVRGAARETYSALTDGNAGDAVLGLSDAAVLAIAALRRVDPEVARAIPPDAEQAVIALGHRDVSVGVFERVAAVRRAGLIIPLAALGLLAAGVLAAPGRRRVAVGWAGLAVAGAGVLVVASLRTGRRLVVAQAPEGTGEASGAVWDAFLADIDTWALVATAAGLVVWLSARGRLRVESVSAGVRTAAEWALRPAAEGRAVLRGLVLVACGIVLAVAWESLVRVAALSLALLIAFRGVELLLYALAPPPRAAEGPRETARERVRRLRVPLGAAGLVAVLACVGLALVLNRGPSTHGPAAVTECNGSAELCDRPVNEVVFAATHNSMAAANEPGWFRAEQTGGIAEQLRFGIRGLLIDTWYGRPGDQGVATDFTRSGLDRRRLVREYGADTIAAVERTRGRLGFGPLTGPVDLFLCHIACEIGATPMEEALAEIRAFLEDEPGAVLILVLQDQITPEDTRRAFIASGLREHVATPSPEGPWPTLGEMIDAGERVIVLSEDRVDPEIPWLLPAFEVMEETPYDIVTDEGLDCRANRGGTGRAFFQLNHWIATPVPSVADAARVNARRFLLERARRCERERGRLPSLIAVDFYERGDLLGVVETLNAG